MRRLFTAEGVLDAPVFDEEMQPDEQVTKLAREMQERRPGMNFNAARREVLRDNPKLAQAYSEQF